MFNIKRDGHVDVVGNMISEGQLVIMARPTSLSTAGGKLEIVRVVKFTNRGVTVEPVAGGPAFNTPYRPDKFFSL